MRFILSLSKRTCTNFEKSCPPNYSFGSYPSLEYRGVDATSSVVNSPFVALFEEIYFETVWKKNLKILFF